MSTPLRNQPDAGQLWAELTAIVGTAHASGRPSSIGLPERGSTAPAWVVRPGSAAEVAELVRLAARHHVAVIPVGTIARAPQERQLADRMRLFVDSRRMDHVLHLDETSLIVHVQAGLAGLALEKILALRGLSLGDYPPATLAGTIGGLLAVRTPGKASARHGFVEDAVLGLSAVLADGRTVHTRVAPRRSTGPDLARALCGSEGTLGFITSAVLRIHRQPEARFLAAHALPDFARALTAANLALKEEATPAALRIYDYAEAHSQLGKGPWRPGEAVMVVATAGPTDLAACDRDLLASAAVVEGGRPLARSVAESWWRRRMGYEAATASSMPSLQVTASPGRQVQVYRAVLEAAASAGAPARAHASRFGLDGAVMFFSVAAPEGGASENAAAALEAAAKAAGAAGAYLLDNSLPAMDPYLSDLRRHLDPHGIMNPGALNPLRDAP